jgi:hypothetical protein
MNAAVRCSEPAREEPWSGDGDGMALRRQWRGGWPTWPGRATHIRLCPGIIVPVA